MNKGKILIVDDEKDILQIFAYALKEEGYELFTAENVKQAVEIAKQQRIDLVFTDLIMSRETGVEVCKEIKKINSNTEVVLFSGYEEQGVKYQVDFVEAGGREEWLRKPVSLDELKDTAKKILTEQEKKQ